MRRNTCPKVPSLTAIKTRSAPAARSGPRQRRCRRPCTKRRPSRKPPSPKARRQSPNPNPRHNPNHNPNRNSRPLPRSKQRHRNRQSRNRQLTRRRWKHRKTSLRCGLRQKPRMRRSPTFPPKRFRWLRTPSTTFQKRRWQCWTTRLSKRKLPTSPPSRARPNSQHPVPKPRRLQRTKHRCPRVWQATTQPCPSLLNRHPRLPRSSGWTTNPFPPIAL